jgi:TRAP-type mannitol/chloroaromatic compound transport system substrate-binding protein
MTSKLEYLFWDMGFHKQAWGIYTAWLKNGDTYHFLWNKQEF